MSSTPQRLLIGLGLLALTAATPAARAKGWQEMHQTSDDVRVTVESDGTALVHHHMRYQVRAGKFSSIELAGVVEGAEPLPEATVVSEKTGEVEAHLEADPKVERALKIVIDDPKGLRRGTYLVDARYRVNLVTAKQLTRDGAMWRLNWVTPPDPDGHDSVRVVFDLPTAVTEPRLVAQGAEGTEPAVDTTMATLRRGAERDELELVRAHVAKGEAVSWSVRVGPRALAKLSGVDPADAQAPAASPSAVDRPPPNRAPFALAACALVMLAVLVARLSRKKAEVVSRVAGKLGYAPRPLLAVASVKALSHEGLARHAGVGVASALALTALVLGWTTTGALLLAAVVGLTTYRAPLAVHRPRGPGRWLPVKDDLLSAPRASWDGAWLDASTWRGRASLVALLSSGAAAAALLFSRASTAGAALALLALALTPLFTTGTRRALPLTARALAAELAPLAPRLRAAGLTVRAVGRQPTVEEGAHAEIDELRLRVTPKNPRPGLGSVELAASSPGVVEVLVRVRDGSPAAARLARIAPGQPVVCGRVPEEKVAVLVPDLSRDVTAFVTSLLAALQRAEKAAPEAGAPAGDARLAA